MPPPAPAEPRRFLDAHLHDEAAFRVEAPIGLDRRELRSRDGAPRVVIRPELRFRQRGEPLCSGDRTAMFTKEPALG